MLALMPNFLAFYLGAIFIERMGLLCGLTLFLVTALAGTIMGSMLDNRLGSLIFRAFNPHDNNNAGRSAVTTPLP